MRLRCKLLREKARHLAVVKGKAACCCCLKGLLLCTFYVSAPAAGLQTWLLFSFRQTCLSFFLACLSVSLSTVPLTERGKICACVTVCSGFHGVTRVQWQTLWWPWAWGWPAHQPVMTDFSAGWGSWCFAYCFKVRMGQSHFSEMSRKGKNKRGREERGRLILVLLFGHYSSIAFSLTYSWSSQGSSATSAWCRDAHRA